MRILVCVHDPLPFEAGPRDALGRLQRGLESRFGRDIWVTSLEESSPPVEAVVALIGPSDARPEAWRANDRIAKGLALSRHRGLPLFVALADGALVPSKENLPKELHPLVDAPSVDVSDGAAQELIWVLEGLREDPSDSVRRMLRRSAKPLAPRRDGPSSVARVRAWLEPRDPILLKISATSGALGLALWWSLGLGPASLFLFLSIVTFLVSKPSD